LDAIDSVFIEVTVELGRAQMPIHQLLKMGRGAVIELDTLRDDPVKIFANNQLVALGEIKLIDDRIAVVILQSDDL